MLITKTKLTSEHVNQIDWFNEQYASMKAPKMKVWLAKHGLPVVVRPLTGNQLSRTQVLATNDTTIAYIKADRNPLGGCLYSVYTVSQEHDAGIKTVRQVGFRQGDKLPNGAMVIRALGDMVLAHWQGQKFVTWRIDNAGNCSNGNYFDYGKHVSETAAIVEANRDFEARSLIGKGF